MLKIYGWFIAFGTLLSGLSLSVHATPLSFEQKNLFTSLVSIDNALQLLAVQYGTDDTRPSLMTEAAFQSTGFQWTTTGTYLGAALSLTANAVYNATSDQSTWTGTGTYAGFVWSLGGNLRWRSDTSFETSTDESIVGLARFFNVAPDVGTVEVSQDGQTVTSTYPTSHLLSFLGITSPWDDKEEISIPAAPHPAVGEKVTEKVTVTRRGEAIKLQGTGKGRIITGESGGLGYIKETTISKVPEPSTLTMLFGGAVFWLLALFWRGRQLQPRRNVVDGSRGVASGTSR
jgi:hypothetical protein